MEHAGTPAAGSCLEEHQMLMPRMRLPTILHPTPLLLLQPKNTEVLCPLVQACCVYVPDMASLVAGHGVVVGIDVHKSWSLCLLHPHSPLYYILALHELHNSDVYLQSSIAALI